MTAGTCQHGETTSVVLFLDPLYVDVGVLSLADSYVCGCVYVSIKGLSAFDLPSDFSLHPLSLLSTFRPTKPIRPRLACICEEPLVTRVRLPATIRPVATTPTCHHVKHKSMPYDNVSVTYVPLLATGARIAASLWLPGNPRRHVSSAVALSMVLERLCMHACNHSFLRSVQSQTGLLGHWC